MENKREKYNKKKEYTKGNNVIQLTIIFLNLCLVFSNSRENAEGRKYQGKVYGKEKKRINLDILFLFTNKL